MAHSISLPNTAKARAALSVVHRIVEAGYIAYLAGGSVRDLLLGRTPKDYDVVTSARPEEIEKLFAKTIPVGKKFGIITVAHQRHMFEVATFRGERGYSDRRRPDEVYWTDAREDALRRDFTVNALFYDPVSDKIYDFVDGLRDIQARVIRFVGNPDVRAEEDYLRLLRAVRLKNVLGFQYDPTTYATIARYAGEIAHISVERTLVELNRMWADASRAQSLLELAEFDLLEVLLPEVSILRSIPQPLEYHREGDVFEHTYRAVKSLDADVPTFLVWAVILHDAGKAETLHYPTSPDDRIRFDNHRIAGAEIARRVGVRLTMPRTEIETIAWLIEHHMNLVGIEKMREAKRRAYLLDPRFPWLLELHHADAAGTVPRDLSLYHEVVALRKKYLALWRSEQKAGSPTPLLTGHDLQEEFGLTPGKKIGALLEQIRDAQLERTISTKKDALALARKLLKR